MERTRSRYCTHPARVPKLRSDQVNALDRSLAQAMAAAYLVDQNLQLGFDSSERNRNFSRRLPRPESVRIGLHRKR